MSIRPMVLPRDLSPVADVMMETSHYPDHPEWSAQSDDQEQRAQTVRRLRRIWPAVRIAQCFSPAMRDVLRGFVWESDSSVGGFTFVQRDGKTSAWEIGPIGVLPQLRRRGIARQMMDASLEMVRSRGGTIARLGVIDGNEPAQALYRSLGFVEYGGSIHYVLAPTGGLLRPTPPAGYSESPLAESDWRTRFELDARVDPPDVHDFEPLAFERYRSPLLTRVVERFVGGSRSSDILVRRTSDQAVVATAGWSVSRTGEGKNAIRACLVPEHADLALYLVRRALAEVLAASPSLRIELFLPVWAADLAREAEACGFVHMRTYRAMGMKLS
ncbi:MAG: GNAT family N-acetyltransferase [Candidatus Bipolaricaulota bacterium]|nr:GNAT family N-acetyltransferase [Candidatus Bipolaricaulota bacterium]